MLASARLMATAPTVIGPQSTRQVFTHVETHPLTLVIVCLKEFGPEFLAWEAETIWDEVLYTYGTTVSDVNKQKIQAARSIYVADAPGAKWEVFEKVAAGLVGNAPRLDVVQRPSPGRALVALDVVTYVRNEKYLKDEVYKYCAAVLMDHGLIYGPGALEPANKFVKGIDPRAQAQVRGYVLRNTTPGISENNPLSVQVMKSLSTRDFAEGIRRGLVQQLAALKL